MNNDGNLYRERGKSMKVKYECNKGIMKFHLTPESDDISSFQIKENSFKTTYTASLGMKSCEFHLPENWTLNSCILQ